MEMLKLFVKKVPTTDSVSIHLGQSHKLDVVAYREQGCTGDPLGRWPWHLSTCPRRNQRTAMLNCYRWELHWIDEPASADELVRCKKLIDDIKLANNGYLILESLPPGVKEFAQKIAKSGIVAITNGLVHMPSIKPEFFKSSYPTKAFAPSLDGPDFEGAILMRQANSGHYD